ncbi:MAG: lipopolysaccharide biosynthesis protein [Sulfuriferula sp.]
MSLGQSIRSGTQWIFFGSAGNQALSFVFGVVLARLLVPADFGALVTIQIFTGLVGYIAGGGMGQALVQARTASNEDYQLVFTLQLIIGIIVYAGFFLFSPLIAHWFDNPLYNSLLKLSALSFVLRPFINIPNSKLFREMRFKESTYLGILTLLVSSFTSITLAYNGYEVWSLVWGGLAGSVAGILVVIPVSGWKPGLHFNFSRARQLASYGFKVSANDLVFYLREQTSNFIISHQMGTSAVGIFNKANSLSQMPSGMISGAVYHPVFRELSKEQDNLDKSRYLYFRALTLVSLYSLPFYVGLWWLADPFVLVIYGAKWQASAQPLGILALAGLFYAIENQSGAVAAAQNKLGIELRIQLASWGLMAIAVYSGLHYGLNGIAWGLLGVYAFNAAAMGWLAQRSLHARFAMLLAALKPALVLNALLFASLLLLDQFIHALMKSKPLTYMLSMAATGMVTYILLFLFMPLSRLHDEQTTWKQKLGLRPQFQPK